MDYVNFNASNYRGIHLSGLADRLAFAEGTIAVFLAIVMAMNGSNPPMLRRRTIQPSERRAAVVCFAALLGVGLFSFLYTGGFSAYQDALLRLGSPFSSDSGTARYFWAQLLPVYALPLALVAG